MINMSDYITSDIADSSEDFNFYFDDPENFATFNKVTNVDGFSILLLNTQRISNINKFMDLKEYLCKLNILPKVIVLVETWINKSTIGRYNLNGYNSYHCCRDTRSGGLVVYVKNGIKCDVKDINDGCVSFIQLILNIVTLDKSTRRIMITAVYMPKKKDSEVLLRLMETWFSDIQGHHLLVGDFNLNTLNPDTTTQAYIDLSQMYGYTQRNNQVTRPASNSIIDHMFSNFGQTVTATINASEISDHNTVVLIIDKIKCSADNNDGYMDLKRIDYYKVNEIISGIFSVNKSYYQNYDCDEMVSFLQEVIQYAIDNSTKIVTKQVKQKHEFTPWINKDIRKMEQTKKRLLKLSKKKPSDTTSQKLLNIDRQLRQAKKIARVDYWNKKFSPTQSKQKLWNNLNEARGKSKSASLVSSLTLNSGEIITGTPNIANTLNKYFLDSCKTMADIAASRIDRTVKINPPKRNEKTIFLIPTTTFEVKRTVTNFQSKHSVGYDNLSIDMVKKTIASICLPLTALINRCFENGYFPLSLKVAKVVALHKGGSSHMAANYRPISLLSPISKVIESVIKIRLMDFLQSNDFFYKRQYGYLPNSGTTMALIETVETISQQLDSSKSAIGLFVDLTKAFDSIDHDLLLSKLDNAGIRGITNDLIRSYLANRLQYVQINNCKSTTEKVTMSVPQGSVLGPILFLIYINDLEQQELHGEFTLFADDTSAIYVADTIEENVMMLEKDLKTLEQYFSQNIMTINATKTTFMVFHSHKKKINTQLNVRLFNQPIKKVDIQKFLGILLDSKLSWKPHIVQLKKDLSKINGLIYHLRNQLSQEVRLMLYNSLFHSKLSYAIETWGSAGKTLIQSLQRTQNLALKAVYNKRVRFSTNQLYENIATTTLPVLAQHEFSVANIVFKMKNNMISTNMQLRKVNHRFQLRRRSNLDVVSHGNLYGYRRFERKSATIWNKFKNNGVTGETLKRFKKSSKAFIRTRITSYL